MGGGGGSTIDPGVASNIIWNYKNALSGFNPQGGGPFSAPTNYSSLIGTEGPPGIGQLTANPSTNTQRSNAILTGEWGYPGIMNVGTGATSGAVNSAQGLLGYQPPQVSAPTSALPQLDSAHGFSGAAITRGDISNINPQSGLGGIDAYMNPYTSSVIDASLKDLNRAREIGINQNASNATLSHAFGGDRQGVTDAETNRAYLDAAGRTIAGLRNQGFDTASGLLQNDQARNLQGQLANQGIDIQTALANTGYGQQANLYNTQAANQMEQFGAGLVANNNQFNAGLQQQAGLANQGAGLQGAGLNLNATGLLGNLGNQQQQQYLQGAGAIGQAGLTEDARQQAYLQSLYQEFLRQQGYPFQAQQTINQSLGLLPASGGTYSQGNPGAALSGFGSILGALALL